MIDDRSLCDRRASPNVTFEAFDSTDAFEQYISDSEKAPACGACLLLAGRVRRQASALIAESHDVYPEDPRESWASLHDTRWASHVDLQAFLKREDLHEIRYDAINDEVDPGSVQQLVTERSDHRKAIHKSWNEYQSQREDRDQ